MQDSDQVEVSGGRAGQIIDERYLLTGELGRGATGTVWAGRDLTTDEPLAIKILHESLLPSPTARRRFHRELVNAAALDHPHSMRVKGDGRTPDGADYLVMERISGPTLAMVLKERGPLPQLRAIQIAAQILDATAAAHRLGIVHRDLKPGNVMLVDGTAGDFVKVCDYGLAKVVEMHDAIESDARAASFSTIQGMMCGTPAYMSPEQARGEELDGRTDLYAIGVMLFQMVVGRLPFEARTPVDVVSAHLSATPPRPRALRPDLDIAPALEGLILRALAKDRRERPSSAEVMRADLLQVERDLERDAGLRTIEVSSRTAPIRDDDTLLATGPAPRPLSPESRSRSRLGGVVAVVAVGALGLVVAGTRASTPPAPPAAAPNAAAAPIAVAPTAPTAPSSAAPTAATLAAAPTPAATVAPSPTAAAPIAATAPRKTPGSKPRVIKPQPISAPESGSADLLREAEAALGAGRLEEARVLGLAAAERQPSEANAWEFLGRCYMRLGRPHEARAFYARSLTLAPNGPKASFLRAIVGPGARPSPSSIP